jgi:hypothetical protein
MQRHPVRRTAFSDADAARIVDVLGQYADAQKALATAVRDHNTHSCRLGLTRTQIGAQAPLIAVAGQGPA